MKKLAIVGGGASGLACALEAARVAGGINITIYEAGLRVGKKLLATGNGRCNLTNMSLDISRYHGSADFAMHALSLFPPESNIEFFNSIGLYTKTEQEGRVYPMSGQAAGVLDKLRYSVEAAGVKTVCECEVVSIKEKSGGFLLNDSIYADAVVIAAGGLVPVSKADKCNCHSLLASLGHAITPVYPSLVQLVVSGASLKALKGLRADVVMSLTASNRLVRREEGELLFTDYGLSGIVSMQLSGEAAKYIGATGKKPSVFVDFTPSLSFERLRAAVKNICLSTPALALEELLSGFMAKRIGQMIIKECELEPQTMPVGSLSESDISLICSKVKSYEFIVSSTRGFEFAQVTAGGADTSQFDPYTLRSLLVPGIYCCGEALDVDADCGGYNLQWAWSSGRLAGKSAAERLGGSL